MPKTELKQQITDLKNETEKLDKNDTFKIIHLNGLIQDVELKIIDEDEILKEETFTLISDLQSIIKQYEIEHPKITKILNRIMNTLSSLGI